MICTNRKKLGKDVGFRFGERHVYISWDNDMFL